MFTACKKLVIDIRAYLHVSFRVLALLPLCKILHVLTSNVGINGQGEQAYLRRCQHIEMRVVEATLLEKVCD
jgi:hypothetical protein